MTVKDNKKMKDMKTMSAGVSATKLENGMSIDLHGHIAVITHTDAEDTTVQYANKARRTFLTHDLNSYLDLKTFPVTTELERPTKDGIERAWINAVTGNCCYRVQIMRVDENLAVGEPRHETFTYADFIAWHMDNGVMPVARLQWDVNTDAANLNEEVAKIAESLKADENEHPFEADLQKEIEDLRAKLATANKEAEQAEINGQIAINKLQREIAALNADLLRQDSLNATMLVAKNEQIERLEAKAAIMNPPVERKEVCTLVQKLTNPEERRVSDAELAEKLNTGWKIIQHDTHYLGGEIHDYYTSVVRFVRDVPTTPAPNLTEKAAEVPHYIGAVPLTPRPPVQPPPMPTNQTIIMGSQPTGRMLTNNGPKPGDTKRIPSTYMQRETDAEVFQDIVKRNAAARAAILNQPSRPFGQ